MASGLQLAALLDGSELQRLVELLHRVRGVPLAILDGDGALVAEAGLDTACGPMARIGAPSCSNESIAELLRTTGAAQQTCEQGLRRLARPLRIGDDELGVLVLRDFLYPEDAIDPEVLARARQRGCRRSEVQAWLQNVPRLGPDQAEELMDFFQTLVGELSRQAVSRVEARRAGLQMPLKEHLEKLVNSIADPLFVKDRKHRWQLLNDAYCQFMGYSREELLGKSDHDFFPKEEADVFWAKDEIVFESGQENLNEEYFTDAQGVTHTILTKKSLYQDQRGAKYIVGIIRDITERKQTEAALIRSQQLAAVGTLAAGIAHEFNNINTSVIGNLQFMLDSCKLSPEAAQLAHRAIRAAGRAAEITGKLLGFANPGRFERRPTDLQTIVHATVSIIEREFATEGISLTVRTGSESPVVLVDSSQISQVLMNLLINARHALLGCAERRITVQVGAARGRAYLRVGDTGCGIAPDKLPKIFLPFFSGKGEHAGDDPVQSRVRGSGLGLSISDTIIRNHGGEITVQSELGRGSEFTVWLPAQGQRRPPSQGFAPEAGSPARPAFRSGRILVLEDEPDVRELLRNVLTRWGHQVTCTDDGEWALAEHARERFDLALVDLQMVPMSGFEFLSRLGDDRPTVVVITGRLQSGLEEEVRRLGAAELLMKPFELAQLRRSLQRLLGQPAVEPET